MDDSRSAIVHPVALALPNAPTPTRTAMVALTVFDIMDSVDAASMLRDDLSGATLIDEKNATVDGKPSTVLRVDVKPSFATKPIRERAENRIEGLGRQ